jgi:hypothetical protein
MTCRPALRIPRAFRPGPASPRRVAPRSAALCLLAVALFLTTMAPTWAGTNPVADIQIKGEAAGDGFANSVEAAGDVNGDGFIDYIAGAAGDDDIGLGSGQAYLFYGPLTHNIGARNADATVTGEAEVDGLGNAVAGAGDVNGDGYDDILIGARSNDSNGIQAGRAYLFYGPMTGTHSALEADAIISGDPFYELGWSVAAAGDVDGDGFGDVLVGAWMADLVGQAFLFLGPLSGELEVADADAAFKGIIFSEELGDAVAAGDLNDDGVPDLILGAPRPPLDGEDPGSVYVFFGPVTGRFLASEADVIVTGQRDNDEFGTAVATGDVDGNGAADLIVGAQQLFRVASGRAYVFYGPLSGSISANDADAILVGEDSDPVDDDLFGQAVASAGDTNGDDVDDVLVGAPTNYSGGTRSGRVYLFYGPLSGRIQASSADRVFTGSTFDLLGTSVAPAGDANGDRLADVLTGAPQFFGTNDFGYAAFFYGEGAPAIGLQIAVTPVDPPIVLLPEGGTVRFLVEVVNRSPISVDFDFWTELERPGGGVRTGSPLSLTLGADQTLILSRAQRIPAKAPPGTYTLRGLVGTFPLADDADAFTFTKISARSS